MENALGWMARSVYFNDRQFNSVDELREATLKARDDMPQEDLCTLLHIMKDCIF